MERQNGKARTMAINITGSGEISTGTSVGDFLAEHPFPESLDDKQNRYLADIADFEIGALMQIMRFPRLGSAVAKHIKAIVKPPSKRGRAASVDLTQVRQDVLAIVRAAGPGGLTLADIQGQTDYSDNAVKQVLTACELFGEIVKSTDSTHTGKGAAPNVYSVPGAKAAPKAASAPAKPAKGKAAPAAPPKRGRPPKRR